MSTEPLPPLGNNLIGKTDGSSGWVSSDLTGTIASPLNPLLAPLGNYGGPTQTMALLPGSPAIDAGNNALIPAGVTTDQRGLPRIVNGTVDIGAFESSGFTIAVDFGQRPVDRRQHSLLRPAGRDGHRQQFDRARGGGPDHIHPAGERRLGHAERQPGDDRIATARRASPRRPTTSAAPTPSRPRPAASRPQRASA